MNPMGSSTSQTTDNGSKASTPPNTWQFLDGLLRHREKSFEDVFAGKGLGLQVRRYLGTILVLSAVFGATMGCMGLSQDPGRGLLQAMSSAVKVPLLYLVSLLVCYPVLYVVVVLMGARMSFLQALAVILMALALNSILLVSCAPIVLFFMFTGSNYDFIKLLHVLIFAFAGGWAMMALWQGLGAMCEKSSLYPRQAVRILKVWMLVFGFVGTQMAWSLRPFVGSPGLEFQLFREGQQGNFYHAVWSSVYGLAQGATKQAPAGVTESQPVGKPPRTEDR
jgi:hypothetical protein